MTELRRNTMNWDFLTPLPLITPRPQQRARAAWIEIALWDIREALGGTCVRLNRAVYDRTRSPHQEWKHGRQEATSIRAGSLNASLGSAWAVPRRTGGGPAGFRRHTCGWVSIRNTCVGCGGVLRTGVKGPFRTGTRVWGAHTTQSHVQRAGFGLCYLDELYTLSHRIPPRSHVYRLKPWFSNA